MTETITGGAYRGTDGSWHDANGKPLPAHVIQQLEKMEQERDTAQAEAPLPPAAVRFVQPTEDTYLREELEAEPVARPKPRRKTKGGA